MKLYPTTSKRQNPRAFISVALLALALPPAPAEAADLTSIVSISDCRILSGGIPLVDCQLENHSDVAVASLRYRIVIAEAGRSVPWGEGSFTTFIPGGIEPGEIIRKGLSIPTIPARATDRVLRFDFPDILALSIGGAAITDPLQPLEFLDGDANVLAQHIAGCWNTGALQGNAPRVILRLAVAEDGRPVSDTIELEQPAAGIAPEVAQAYEAARRAVLRCGANGLPVGDMSMSSLQSLRLLFDTFSSEVRALRAQEEPQEG